MRKAALAIMTLLCSFAEAEALQVVTPESVGLSAERLARIDETFRRLVDDGQIAGASLLISRRGQVAYRRDLGFMDVENEKPMASDAIFRIASMTKALTSVAVLQLFEQGRFMLDNPAARFVPVLKTMRVMDPNQTGAEPGRPRTVALARDITIRDLLRHTAGIYGGSRYTQAGLRNWTGSLQGFVDRLASVPLDCQPGTRFQYGYSTDVLGYLVEVVSGKPLDEYFAEHILTPLDMRDTGFVVPPDKVSRLTNHYSFAGGQLVCKEEAATSPFLKRAEALSGGGGWSYSYPGVVSTVRDWWRFMEMLRHHGQLDGVRILSPTTVKLMCSDHLGAIPGAFEPGAGFGLGVGIVTDSVKHGQLASNGTIYWAGGPHNTYHYVDFKEQMCGILFMQTEPWNHLDLMRRFLVLSHQAIQE
ncbi:MAG: beta-lactamase family protein [Sedimentisphaerales bacterium]|nr:beta-lactamase family protein [Sedimentisphaerales bacterium]